jgi:RNA polymerase sigma-70 factor (sigma-E family)
MPNSPDMGKPPDPLQRLTSKMVVSQTQFAQQAEPVRKDPPPIRAVADFESFYRTEYRPVVGLAYALSGSRIAAEDIAQDAFLAAHKQWDRVAFYDKPEAWVRRVVSNLSVSFFRTRFREASAIARMKSPGEYLPELPEDDATFWKTVRSLPKRQAQTLALHYLEDRAVAEIAEILGCSPSTVKVHMHKGRAALARKLGETGVTS